MEAKTEVKKVSFLQNKKVLVKPVVRPQKWVPLTGNSLDLPNLYEDTSVSLSVPLDRNMGGTLKRVLDNIEKVKTPQYDDPVTQEEFFERMLDRDLSITKKTNNFWKSDPISYVELTKDDLILDLSNPEHMLKYLILMANKSKVAGPNVKNPRQKLTYQFYIVDIDKETEKIDTKRSIKKKASRLYNEMESDLDALKDFVLLTSNGLNKNAKPNWYEDKVFDYAENKPEEFIKILEDARYKDKVFIAKALYIKEIGMVGEVYTINGMDIGKLDSLIGYLHNPKNNLVFTKIKQRIENSVEFQS